MGIEMIKYDLYKLLKEELKNGSNTRPSGQVIRKRIERDIEKEDFLSRVRNSSRIKCNG
ncbi:MAG: hypothetical protein HZB80_07500 [Deltaproteobacteria bacterium]|nr:hypothetical protein [Deltaproteobacteria bacterium]